MPQALTYPGVYIDEVESAVHTITGVATSTAAFVGTAPRGPTDRPVHITSFADYARIFGGVVQTSPMSYGVYLFFLNGGHEAEIVRIVHTTDATAANNAAAATISLPGTPAVPLVARGEGSWGNEIRVRVDYNTKEDPPAAGGTRTLYNLSVFDHGTGLVERFLNVSKDPTDAYSLDNALAASLLVDVPATGAVLNALPNEHVTIGPADPVQDPFDDSKPGRYTKATGGGDGNAPVLADYQGGATGEADKKGIFQLLKTDIFNMLCLPGAPTPVRNDAVKLCVDRRAMFIHDPPQAWTSVDATVTAMASPPIAGDAARNAAVYFPNIIIDDPAQGGVARTVPPSGALAGIWARTDDQRGVWKAPAGIDAALGGVTALTVPMTDLENGRLNQLGVNCLRTFPVVGPVSWGARTLRGADRLGDSYKYLPVRRTALFLEESLYRGTQWVVFEPNDEPLWASIRLNVGAFMNSLFAQGAFQGATPREAYLVKCDAENNPQNDIDRGIVNILVGFAPLKPAEFVLIHIEQLAGQLQV